MQSSDTTPVPLAERIERLTTALVSNPSGPAVEELASILTERLTLGLRHRWPRTDADDVTDAIHDAILDHIRHADRSAGLAGHAILSHVTHAAWCNLKNRVQSDQARVRREGAYGAERERVGADSARRVVDLCMSSPAQQAVDQSTDKMIDQKTLAKLGAHGLIVLRMIRAGIHDTNAFAQALGLLHLCEPERQAEVKKEKDRVKAILRRMKARPPRPG